MATPQALAKDILDLTRSILQQTGETARPDPVAHNPFVQRHILWLVMDTSSYCAITAIEMESWTTSPCFPSLFFYTSSLFTHSVVSGPLILPNPNLVTTDIPFRSMCSTIHAYRERTIDKGIVDSSIQERLQDKHPVTFSDLWWDQTCSQVS